MPPLRACCCTEHQGESMRKRPVHPAQLLMTLPISQWHQVARQADNQAFDAWASRDTEIANHTKVYQNALPWTLGTGHKPQFRGLQGPLLDKPIPLPSASKAEKEGFSVWNAQEQRASSSLPRLDRQPLVGSCHASTIQKPLTIVYSTLGTPHSIESLKKSTQYHEPEACSISTLSTSGYVADEESSKTSLINSKKRVKPTKRITPQGGSNQSSRLFTTSPPGGGPLKIQRQTSRGQSTQQAGGEE
ncbi:protein TNT [Meriones unguiculatus]|uniref:protein TNT n=1 Tax=Meriones unguiculatus TaxID=10047 RepID=UPI000B4ED5F3|nr:protein TNT [Meriones unguiculatus]